MATAKYVARCYAQNEDIDRRNLVAVVKMHKGNDDYREFIVQVLTKNEEVMYEKTLSQMPGCWFLTKDDFIFMEDMEMQKLTHVQFKQGRTIAIKDYYLPNGTIIKPQINANLEQLVETFDCENKQELRDNITSLNSNDGLTIPEMYKIVCERNKIFYLAKGTENKDKVRWFKPDMYESGKRLSEEDTNEVTLYNEGQVIGIIISMQSTGRNEFWTISENRSSRRLGLELYWAEGVSDEMILRHGSDNWNYPMTHQVVKVLYMRAHNQEEEGDYNNRTLWKDKQLILLDTAGVVWRTVNWYSWEQPVKQICTNCIDIQVDHEKIYVKLMNEEQNGSDPQDSIEQIDIHTLERQKLGQKLEWADINDELGPLNHPFTTPHVTGGLLEKDAREWSNVAREPLELGTIIARIDPNVDKDVRKFTGVIRIAEGNRYSLQVLQDSDGHAIFERVFGEMPDAWLLTENNLIYQERFSNKTITYVDLTEEGKNNKVAYFKLPNNVSIVDHVCASMEPFVQGHTNDNKQIIRDMIKRQLDGPVGKLPVSHMMAKVDDKVVVICNDQVLYFRPERHFGNPRGAEATIQLNMTDLHLQILKGVPQSHTVIGCLSYSQNTKHKYELVTFSEDLESKQWGLQIFWENHEELEIQHMSDAWRWEMPNRPIKFVYLNKRSPDDTREYQERDLWRDKRLMVLDSAGETYHLHTWQWHRPYKRLQGQCIDIQQDREHFYMYRLLEDMSHQHVQANYHDFKTNDVRKNFKWSNVLHDPVPTNIADEKDWILTDDLRDWMNGLQRACGKNLQEQANRLEDEELEVSDLFFLSEQDYESMGFSLALKSKVKRYLYQRETIKGGKR